MSGKKQLNCVEKNQRNGRIQQKQPEKKAKRKSGAKKKSRIIWNCSSSPILENAGNKTGAIVFIDELDAIGTKRFGGEQSGDREVQRTMLELLSQLDGFSSDEKIKV